MNGLIPITVTSRVAATAPGTLDSIGFSSVYSGSAHGAQIGQNTPGIDDVDRIVFSLRLGIDSEVTWSLSTLTRVSLHPSFSLEKVPFVGHELIRIFLAPYTAVENAQFFTQHMLSQSSDALLTLRNLAQDLPNQQWLSQVPNFKRLLIRVVKFYYRYFFNDETNALAHIRKFDDNLAENFTYLLDLLEPLTCYYIDNPKNDALFQVMLDICVSTTDKAVFVTSLNCLSHLLITRPQIDMHVSSGSSAGSESSLSGNLNCIDALTEHHLEKITSMLLIDDDELAHAVLQFLNTYLSSQALHADYPESVSDSQHARLVRLLQLKSSLANLFTLFKRLPMLILSGLPLRDAARLPPMPSATLTRRSQFGGLPPSLPILPPDLYAQILRLDEPLRATTWLRCCYEPYTAATTPPPTRLAGAQDVMPGEVTQISLWKAYEKQFREVWELLQLPAHRTDLKPLLAAVEFIKNVSLAFPNSEAMVVNLEQEPGEAPKRKFIIKGIQPRQFAVSIDTGNYDALKPVPAVSENDDKDERHLLPIGHIDAEKYKHEITAANSAIFAPEARITRKLPGVNAINLDSYKILDRIVTECFGTKSAAHLVSIFRLLNGWLPNTVYANPTLLEAPLVNMEWLQYLM